ncbi:uncharacterized protein LOC110685241 isoform X2 [Chenopodium quinoa]|uniref:uncharacterized protein LOC110685241 isoform X2 n=1 Tax=Chenopodium quinoa TaxID=63459 RepID=UPI000B79426D|nr:uncharacterized protein LOC110685241 isoform X2 [Chenopodium quinoa]
MSGGRRGRGRGGSRRDGRRGGRCAAKDDQQIHDEAVESDVDDDSGGRILLKILYLDWLRRPPVKWGVLPRMKVWTEVKINKAKKADRHREGDFRKLGTINVSYGRPHERSALDVIPGKRRAVAAEVVEALLQSVDLQEEDGEENLSAHRMQKSVQRMGMATLDGIRHRGLVPLTSLSMITFQVV